MLLSPAIQRHSNSLIGQIARDFSQTHVRQSPPPKYHIRIYDDVHSIIFITKAIRHTRYTILTLRTIDQYVITVAQSGKSVPCRLPL